MIRTNGLQLLEVKPIHIELFWRDKSQLAAMLQVTLPEAWPCFPHAFSPDIQVPCESDWSLEHWRGYFFIHPADGVLVGNGGFKSPPNESATVEIGYEIAPKYWNRGFATEAVQGMIDYAFTHQAKTVMAHTLAEKNASNSVLQKVGMEFVAEIDNSKIGKIWQWQISSKEYAPI